MKTRTKRFVALAIVAGVAVAGVSAWVLLRPNGTPEGFASANGRI